MIGIIGAMDEEIAIILENMNDTKELVYSSITFWQGKIATREIVLMKSGIGKVNAAVSTTILFERFPIEYVINIGTAGGVKSECNVLDIVISEQVAYHDVDVTAFNYQYGQVPHLPLFFTPSDKLLKLTKTVLNDQRLTHHIGLIVSGDAFIHEEEQINKIKEHFNAVLAVEMEAAAISHVCHLYQKPFIILRSLSDIAGKKSSISFDHYLERASLNASTIVIRLLEQID